jgi:signal transduction histidine kinase
VKARARSAPRVTTLLRWATPGILVLALLATTLALAAYRQESEVRVEETHVLARAAAVDLNRYLQSQLGTLEAIAESDPVRALDAAAMRAFFNRIEPPSIGFDGQIFWIDGEGVMRARSAYDGPPLDFTDREWVQEVLATGVPYVSNSRMGQLNQAPIVVLAVPTFGDDDRQAGALGAAFRLDRATVGAYSLRSAGGIPVVIADRTGAIIAGPEPVHELRMMDPGFPAGGLPAGSGSARATTGPLGDADRVVGYARVPTAGWLVLVDRPVAEVLGPARDRLLSQLGLIAVVTVLAGLTVLWSTGRTAAALREQEAAYAAETTARAELEVAVAELRQREELREAFVGVLSHELRTPVTTIYGMASILTRTPDREDRASIGEDIRDEADRLYRIIEDLLVLSRAERGALTIAPEPVLAQRIIPTVAADLTRRFPAARFSFVIPEDLPPVAAEEGPLRQVLGNLLTNAAKYGAGSPVRLSARDLGDRVEFLVEDEGPGIDSHEVERLFELFYRAPGTSRKASGTGIGLYVVRQLVEAMGGTVAVMPNRPRGAAFVVRLRPYRLALEPVEEPSSDEQGIQRSVRVADRPADATVAVARPPANPLIPADPSVTRATTSDPG